MSIKRSDLELLGIAAALLAAALYCSGCKTTSSSESHMAASAAETLTTDQQTDTHIVDAPDRTTTTIEEFGGGTGPGALLVDSPAQRESPAVTSSVAPAVPATGRYLVKRTVTVTEHGAVTIDTHAAAKSQEREDSTLFSESKTKSSTDFLHSPFALLGGLVALAGVAFAAWKLLKPRLLP